MIAVLDASVVLKWFHREPDTDCAERIRRAMLDEKLYVRVPGLLPYEIANVLVWKAGVHVSDVVEVLDVISRFPWHIIHPSRELLATAVTIAARYRTSVYDATYVALAVESDAVLVTADKKLVEKIASPNVVLLHDFSFLS